MAGCQCRCAGTAASSYAKTHWTRPVPSLRHMFGAVHGLPQAHHPRGRIARSSRCWISNTVTTCSATQRSSHQVPQEVVTYWTDILSRIDRPSARKLISHLDLSFPLGINPQKRNNKTVSVKYSRNSLFTFFEKVKMQHPTKVLLVRVGEFYESMGVDAVLLVQYAGLNPMGEGKPPRAGCPIKNIRRTLRDLVEGGGLSVVVCEEAPEPYSYGSRSKGKQRYIAGVVTPASPNYLHGLVDEQQDDYLESAPPVLGIASSISGYMVMEVSVDMRSCVVTQGMTEDAVTARIHEGGMVLPLYLHRSSTTPVTGRLSEGTVESEWEHRVKQIFRSQSGIVKRYESPDPVTGMLTLVKLDNNIPPEVDFKQLVSHVRDRPKPVFYTTACQLGIHRTLGVPNLLDAIMPSGCPVLVRRWMRKLLLLPPPYAIAQSIREACNIMADMQHPLPDFPVVNPANIVLKLRSKEGNDVFYRELHAVTSAVLNCLTAPQLCKLAAVLLPPTCQETGAQLQQQGLTDACRGALSLIEEVIDRPEELSASKAATDVDVEVCDDVFGTEMDMTGVEVLAKLLNNNEDFRGKIKPQRLAEQYSKVAAAGVKVEAALRGAFRILQEHAAQFDSSFRMKPAVVYDCANNAVWMRVPRKSSTAKHALELGLVHPIDRNGKPATDFYSTDDLEAAQDEYRSACADARAAVREQLGELALRLQVYLPELVCASTFAVIAGALESHVNEASTKGWALPQQHPPPPPPPQQQTADSNGVAAPPLPPFEINGMWPYWLDGRSSSTVFNSFSLDCMAVLTGPNMAGKSTILRSTCAVALLAACGLYAPVRSANVPYFDAFMLRNFSADSPVEGMSAFAMEMKEMRYLLEDVSAHSLVLVDELGKGTEVHAGTAIAAALLEGLDGVACRGVFATHLHQLFTLDISIPSMKFLQMEVKDVALPNGGVGRAPTLRMVDGRSEESLALEVAAKCGLPQPIINRAGQLYQALLAPKAPGGAPSQRLLATRAPSSTSVSTSLPLREGPSIMEQIRAGQGSMVLTEASSSSKDEREDGTVWRTAKGNSLEEAMQIVQTSAAALLTEATRPYPELAISAAQALVSSSADEPSAESHNGNGNGASDSEASSGRSWNGTAHSESGAAGHSGNGAIVLDDVFLETVRPRFVRKGQVPPPSTTGRSCVYVLRRDDGYFYCGQTDNLKGRLATHRKKSSRVSQGRDIECGYIVLPDGLGSKSVAEAVESRAIWALQDAGVPMLSTTDQRHKRLPKGSTRVAIVALEG